MTDQHNPLERAVDLFVYAPIGVAMFAKDTVPTFLKMFVSRGQTELEQKKKTLHHQANQYRAVGKLAVKYGGPEVKRQAESKLDGARKLAEETFTGLVVARSGGGDDAAPTPTPKVTRVDEPAKIATNGAVNGTANGATHGAPVIHDPLVEDALAPTSVPTPDAPTPPEAPTLAIPEYDQLSASQVVERLDGLSPDELDAVRVYELAHRGRNTILGKITQLTS